jgi:hypothetical protein
VLCTLENKSDRVALTFVEINYNSVIKGAEHRNISPTHNYDIYYFPLKKVAESTKKSLKLNHPTIFPYRPIFNCIDILHKTISVDIEQTNDSIVLRIINQA